MPCIGPRPMNAWIETRATVVVRANPVCWLLMVDIKRYTSLSRQLDTDALSLTIGTWLRQCRDTVESAGGVVDKFLGDAIFACWKNTAAAAAALPSSWSCESLSRHLLDGFPGSHEVFRLMA